MIEELENLEPLSQVWFVFDYIQLQFEKQTISILNTPRLKLMSGAMLERNSAGFCDNLVSQIGQSIQNAQLQEGHQFTIMFSSGVELIVPLSTDAVNGPEAIELPRGYIVFNT